MATPLRSHRLRNPHTYFMKHVRLVSWFISCSPTQSLYPGRPRGGLTVFPSRHLSPDADLRNPEGLLCTCAPPRARSSCPTVPLSELPDPHLRMVEDFVSLARPLATALWPRPSSSTRSGMCKVPSGARSYRARTARHLRNRAAPPAPPEQPLARQTRTSSHQGHDAAPPDSRIQSARALGL